jgi:phosphoglycolate phosphatase-like HAD superfamily hydrolase
LPIDLPKQPSALLFDLDGTLVDSDPMHERTWAEFLKPRGVAVDAALYRTRFSGRLNPEIVTEFLPQLDRAADVQAHSPSITNMCSGQYPGGAACRLGAAPSEA